MVWIALNSFSDEKGQCFPSITAIAKRAGYSERSTRYALVTLKKTGWAQPLHQTSLKTTLYQLKKLDVGNPCHEGHLTSTVMRVEAPIVATRATRVATLAYELESLSTTDLEKEEAKEERDTVPPDLDIKKNVKKKTVRHRISVVMFNPETAKVSELSEKVRLKLHTAFPLADIDYCTEKMRVWIVRNNNPYQDYWKTLCSFCSGSDNHDPSAIIVNGKALHFGRADVPSVIETGKPKLNPLLKDTLKKIHGE